MDWSVPSLSPAANSRPGRFSPCPTDNRLLRRPAAAIEVISSQSSVISCQTFPIEHGVGKSYSFRMIDLISQKYDDLVELCRQSRVDHLDLFGSAATGDFDPSSSDLDFVIEFEDRAAPGLLNRYLDFAAALERLFGRHVDLLTPRSIRNPYFRQTLDSTRETLYDHRVETAHP